MFQISGTATVKLRMSISDSADAWSKQNVNIDGDGLICDWMKQ